MKNVPFSSSVLCDNYVNKIVKALICTLVKFEDLFMTIYCTDVGSISRGYLHTMEIIKLSASTSTLYLSFIQPLQPGLGFVC